jgi:hypothetical protein
MEMKYLLDVDFVIYDSLSPRELAYSKKIYSHLKTRIGKRKCKTAQEIKGKVGLYFLCEDPTFRKIIHYLRLNVDSRICACGKGYYIAENDEELDNFINRLKARLKTQAQMIYHLEQGVRNFDK